MKEKKDRDRKAVRLLLESVCGGRHRQGRTLQGNKRKNEGDRQDVGRDWRQGIGGRKWMKI